MRTETRELCCKLDALQLHEKQKECVTAASAVQDREAEKKHAVSRYGNALKEAQEKLGKLIKVCETGQEVKPVTCEWRPDFLAGVRRLIRIDTFEEVDVRTLTESERQTQLQLDEAAAKRGEDVDVPGMPEEDGLDELERDNPFVEPEPDLTTPFDAPDDEAGEDEEPDESFVEGALAGADGFEKNGVRHVSPDAGLDFGAAVSEATK